MGDAYSHAHAAALAAQLPKGSRCRAAENPRDAWDEKDWMLWRMEWELNALRWSFVKYDGEQTPLHMPYPGQKLDEAARAARLDENRAAVDAAFTMNGGDDEH